MNAQTGYVSAEEIIAAAMYALDDIQEKRHPKGYYLGLLRDAMKEMGFDSMFPTYTASGPITGPIMKLPDGVVGIKSMYAYNGEYCNVDTATPIRWKPNFHRPGGTGYLADNRWKNEHDPLQDTHVAGGGSPVNSPDDVCFYNIQNGSLMLSDRCLSYGRIFIRYAGVNGALEKCPAVPFWAEQAILDWVVVRAAMIDMAREPKLQGVFGVFNNSLRSFPDGSWHKAKKRVSEMDENERKSLRMYLHGIGHGQ